MSWTRVVGEGCAGEGCGRGLWATCVAVLLCLGRLRTLGGARGLSRAWTPGALYMGWGRTCESCIKPYVEGARGWRPSPTRNIRGYCQGYWRPFLQITRRSYVFIHWVHTQRSAHPHIPRDHRYTIHLTLQSFDLSSHELRGPHALRIPWYWTVA